MKKDLTEIVFILDESGSMGGLESDTIGGYNSFLSRQKEVEGEAYVSTVIFNDSSRVLHDRIPLSKIEPLTERQYTPGGSTALLDAIGGAVKHIGNIHKYAREEDVPEKTIFVITTDGEENSSRTYSYDKVSKMIKHQKEKYGWEFLFLGANIDAVAEASKIGISANRAVRYECDSLGTQMNYSVLSKAVGELRKFNFIDDCWSAEIKEYHDKKNR